MRLMQHYTQQPPEARPPSTKRVAAHRARMRSTKQGEEELKSTNRVNSKKYRLKAKNEREDIIEKIAHYEDLLGVERSAKDTGQEKPAKRQPTYLPPEDEIRGMSPEDIAAWQKEQRMVRKKQSYERKKAELAEMKARLATLEGMWRNWGGFKLEEQVPPAIEKACLEETRRLTNELVSELDFKGDAVSNYSDETPDTPNSIHSSSSIASFQLTDVASSLGVPDETSSGVQSGFVDEVTSGGVSIDLMTKWSETGVPVDELMSKWTESAIAK